MLAQQLLNGLLLGATYALFALGFTLMFGVLRVVNLTYGFYFTAGAFVALWLTQGGVSIGLDFNAIHPYMGEAMMLRGFVVIVVGGLGDIFGALAAGLLLGVIEVLTAGYLASGLKEAVAFALLVLVLWTRPAGLFGSTQSRKA